MIGGLLFLVYNILSMGKCDSNVRYGRLLKKCDLGEPA